jgi:hypothetical protein
MYDEEEKMKRERNALVWEKKFERLPAVVGSLSQSSRKYKRKNKNPLHGTAVIHVLRKISAVV